MKLQKCLVVTKNPRLLFVLLSLLSMFPVHCASYQLSPTHIPLADSNLDLSHQRTPQVLPSATQETTQDHHLQYTTEDKMHRKSTTSTGVQEDFEDRHLQQLEDETEDTVMPQEEHAFPYQFESIAFAAAKNPMVKLGMPYTIKKARPHLEDQQVPQDRVGLQNVDLEAQNVILPSRDDSAQGIHHQMMRPTRRPFLTKTELDFLGILAAIVLKLTLSTALATWFLAAGQVLYGLASITGTTAVFGMDSSIRYIYKTLPFIEALLRGETIFT